MNIKDLFLIGVVAVVAYYVYHFTNFIPVTTIDEGSRRNRGSFPPVLPRPPGGSGRHEL